MFLLIVYLLLFVLCIFYLVIWVKTELTFTQDDTWDNVCSMGKFQGHNFPNVRQTRVLILSGTKIDDKGCYNKNTSSFHRDVYTVLSNENLADSSAFQRDCERVKVLEKCSKTNKIIFNVLDLSIYFTNGKTMSRNEYKENVKMMLEEVRKFWPTMIVLPFSSIYFNDAPVPLRYNENKFNSIYRRLDLVNELQNYHLLEDLIKKSRNYMIFRSRNIFQVDECLLMSSTFTSVSGLRTSFQQFFNYLRRIGSTSKTRVLIISGSHGSKNTGFSGLTQKDLLHHGFYVETCEVLGVSPQKEDDVSIPLPGPQQKDPGAKDDALLNEGDFEDIKFHVLNIKHFHNNKKEFLMYVKEYNPTAVVIDWCYSKDGDVANVLCTSGVLSEMWLSAERNLIVGVNEQWIKLGKEQKQLLDQVSRGIQNDNLKHVILWGIHGTGKTVLGAEIAKMFMAKIRNSGLKYNLYIIQYTGLSGIKANQLRLLQRLETNVFGNEDFCDEKKYYSFKDLENETGLKIKYYKDDRASISGKDVITKFINKQCEKDGKKQNVIFMDEICSKIFLKEPTSSDSSSSDNDNHNQTIDFSSHNIGENENVYTITCVSPYINKPDPKLEYKIKSLDDQNILKEQQTIVKELKITYRNSKAIQFFFNVFWAHVKSMVRNHGTWYEDILAKGLQHTDEDGHTNEEKHVAHLPSGETPILIKYKKKINQRTGENVEDMKREVLRRICNQTTKESISVLCFNRYHDCTLCQKIKSDCEKKFGEQKMVMTRHDDGYFFGAGFGGCEDENVIIHYTSSSFFEFMLHYKFNFPFFVDLPFWTLQVLSRARKNMLLMFEEGYLKLDIPYAKAILEIISHDQQDCGNGVCKSKGWTEIKVVDVINMD